MHRCMGTKTISLEDSAYSRLKADKRPGESFSHVVNRVLGASEPSFLDFRGLLHGGSADRRAERVARMKREDIRAQRAGMVQKRSQLGHHGCFELHNSCYA